MGAEVDRIAALGVRFTSNHRVEDLEAERREGAFDAVFVAVGAHLSKRVDIPAADAGPIWTRCRSCATSRPASGR
jgi:NADPH-dependent glutamate synthase beta subunit-like oxidoreductase